ncbi:unnamed protein product [Clonostachys rosea]|uniref:Transcription factor domain-containing protein n=1 Tax=Bionectria ochroleuca TaxID=29856 RepID=A0ABY6UHK7_BIOOC|nr:unnamed protein product [Clonostachys rosea]
MAMKLPDHLPGYNEIRGLSPRSTPTHLWKMPREFQFVAVLRPTEPVPLETRKLTHSHARRETHAMKKRLRIQRGQSKAIQVQTENSVALFPPPFPGLSSRILSSRKDAFSVLPRPLCHQEHFLLDHYIRIVVPYATATCHALFSGPGNHQERVFREWVGLALTDQDLFDTAVLLRACRHILATSPDDPALSQMALLYKQRGLQRLRQSLGDMPSPVNALIVAMALSLAIDEDSYGEIGVARLHAEGVFNMVDLGGGPGSIGLTGLLQTLYEAWQQIFKTTRYLAL